LLAVEEKPKLKKGKDVSAREDLNAHNHLPARDDLGPL
jgi:hypothetical protein